MAKPPKGALTILPTVSALTREGYRFTILGLLSRGMKAQEIASYLEAHHSVQVTEGLIRTFERSLAISSTEATSLAIRRETQAHKEEAILAYQEFKSQYLAARESLSHASSETAPIHLDTMRFAADQFGKWWDRIGRHLPIGVASDNGLTNNSILTIIAQETRNGRIDPASFDRIIDRLDPDSGPGAPPTPANPPAQAGQVLQDEAGRSLDPGHPEPALPSSDGDHQPSLPDPPQG